MTGPPGQSGRRLERTRPDPDGQRERPDVVARLVGRKRKAGPLEDLTPREREILALIAEGRSSRARLREA